MQPHKEKVITFTDLFTSSSLLNITSVGTAPLGSIKARRGDPIIYKTDNAEWVYTSPEQVRQLTTELSICVLAQKFYDQLFFQMYKRLKKRCEHETMLQANENNPKADLKSNFSR